MIALSGPVAIFTDTALCDRHPQHEVTIVTDGRTAYTYGNYEAGQVVRAGVVLTAACEQPSRGDEPCEGEVTWRLDSPGGWVAATEDHLRTLSTVATAVEE